MSIGYLIPSQIDMLSSLVSSLHSSGILFLRDCSRGSRRARRLRVLKQLVAAVLPLMTQARDRTSARCL